MIIFVYTIAAHHVILLFFLLYYQVHTMPHIHTGVRLHQQPQPHPSPRPRNTTMHHLLGNQHSSTCAIRLQCMLCVFRHHSGHQLSYSTRVLLAKCRQGGCQKRFRVGNIRQGGGGGACGIVKGSKGCGVPTVLLNKQRLVVVCVVAIGLCVWGGGTMCVWGKHVSHGIPQYDMSLQCCCLYKYHLPHSSTIFTKHTPPPTPPLKQHTSCPSSSCTTADSKFPHS